MELYEHNQETYERALSMLEVYKECAIDQATGTGKSFKIGRASCRERV